MAGLLRGFLRGWGANHGSEAKRAREALIDEIKSLDAQAACRPFLEAEWASRYALENQVLAILREEEEYWCQRGSMNWVLFGDANTSYFQAIANGLVGATLSLFSVMARRSCSLIATFVLTSTGSTRTSSPPLLGAGCL